MEREGGNIATTLAMKKGWTSLEFMAVFESTGELRSHGWQLVGHGRRGHASREGRCELMPTWDGHPASRKSPAGAADTW